MVSLSSQAPTLNQLWVLKCRQHKSTPAFLFSLSALCLIHIFPPKKRVCTFFTAMDTTNHNTPQNVHNWWAQMWLGRAATNMCLGFTRHILIGHLGRHEKRNAGVIWYCVHLRPTLTYCGTNELVLWKRKEPPNTGKTLNFFWLFLKIINKSWLLSPNLIFPDWKKGLVQEGECTGAHSYPLFLWCTWSGDHP
jgi:hypothetical protein